MSDSIADDDELPGKPEGPLRKGWTTGACAAAGAKAAFSALATGDFPDPVTILLPGGQTPAFALAREDSGPGWAMAAIVKDAGDDPDVTHGAVIETTVRLGTAGDGISYKAGDGVGMVTRAGLPIAPGEPAINPGPRGMIETALAEVSEETGAAADVEIEIAIPGGAEIAEKTWNPRLGIVGGLSILGTTGIVVPYSCAAWIHSIHRGIDVARAAGIQHVAGSTGARSEQTVAAHHDLPLIALLDMGDFAGGMLKYLRQHPIQRVTIAGGVAKMTKLAQGFLDLHSRKGAVDKQALADTARLCGGDEALAGRIAGSNTTAEAFAHAGAASIALGDRIAADGQETALKALGKAGIDLEVLVIDRAGRIVGRAPFSHPEPPGQTGQN
ncbi:MAG: cobalt-precorrin-5B (C(1))-methyltransferase [Pseudomonadota bacterium]